MVEDSTGDFVRRRAGQKRRHPSRYLQRAYGVGKNWDRDNSRDGAVASVIALRLLRIIGVRSAIGKKQSSGIEIG